MSTAHVPVAPVSRFALAVRARAEQMPGFLYDHSLRTFQLASVIALSEGWEVDAEVLYGGALLHDLGLAEPPADDVQFEAHGAETVRTLALEHGLGKQRADNAWDVVALHASGLADFKSMETAAVGRAVSADVSGRGLDALAPALVEEIFGSRAGFASPFFEAVLSYAASHPGGSVFTWLHPVVQRHIAGFPSPDLREAALGHPYECKAMVPGARSGRTAGANPGDDDDA